MNEFRGKKIKLISCFDPAHMVDEGTVGIVKSVDALGRLYVRWETGMETIILPNFDEFEILK